MKTNKKFFSWIIWIIIFLIFSFTFWWEYKNFQTKTSENNLQNQEIIKNAENFSVQKIRTLDKTSLFYTPNKELLDDFTKKIDSAKNQVFIEVYMFTEKRILASLKKAKKRWVSVKVLLEKKPYLSENINKNIFQELEKNGIDVAWSNTKNYYYNHSKFFIIDDEAIISTWNLTYSLFTQNRDFLIFTKDKIILENLKNIFEADFEWKKLDFYDDNLIFSPNYSRIKLEKFLNSATKNIKIYIQYLKDESINNLLLKIKKEKNIEIEIITDKKQLNDENIKKLQNNWIKINFFNWKTMHSKAILIDETYLFIWSINFSKTSIDKNREAWIFIKNEDLIKKFLEIFKKDSK